MNNSKKRILMVHNFYQIGGGEHTVFNNEVDLLRSNGHEVITYTRDNKELKNKFKLLLMPFTTIWSFKTYREVKIIIKKEKINIVHCHNTFPLISPSVYYAAKKCNIPVVQTFHNFRFICPGALFYCKGKTCEKCLENNNFKEALKNKCYRNSKIQTLIVTLMLKIHRFLGTYKKINYIFLTEFNRSKFDKLIGKDYKYAFIKPNFVKNEFELKNNKQNKFIYIGRLDENKGIKFLLKCWEKVDKKYDLHIYGDGINRNLVEEYTKKYNNIKYYGFKDQKEIFNDLSESKGLVFPSALYEGFPMTIAESFALGIPVLSTNIGNQKSIVKNAKGGVLFELNNEESFIKSLKTIIDNNEEYSKNAIEYYKELLSPEKNYKELINIYENAKVIK